MRRPLVVLVHGLNGRGYGTWKGLPARLFDGELGIPLDLGIFDYRSGLRRLSGGKADLRFWVRQLLEHIAELEEQYHYTDIFLMGHSLGGVVVEEVAKTYLSNRLMAHYKDAGALAALIFASSPRIGAGLALRVLAPVSKDVRVLVRLSQRASDVHEFFVSRVEQMNVVEAAAERIVLPMYAAIGGRDRLVSEFSATLNVPGPHRQHLDASHSDICKPTSTDTQFLSWLQQYVIAPRLGVRHQERLEANHANLHRQPVPKPPDPKSLVVTRFVSDRMGLAWEEIYNEVREAATTGELSVFDSRDVPGVEADLHLAVHDAQLVITGNAAVKQSVMDTLSINVMQPVTSVGICPVGLQFTEAESVVHEWLDQGEALNSLYVQGAPDAHGLRAVLARLLQLVIGRHPRRHTSSPVVDHWSAITDDDSGQLRREE